MLTFPLDERSVVGIFAVAERLAIYAGPGKEFDKMKACSSSKWWGI
jgi:hypothetical protein